MTTIDMIEETALQEALQSHYGWDGSAAITLLQDGQAGNRTYLLRLGEARHIFRVYGSYWRGKEDRILFELELLRHLREHGVPVSAPIPRQSGELIGQVTIAQETRPAALFHFADGSGAWPLPESDSHRLGAAMATLHRVAVDFPIRRSHTLYDTAHLVDLPVQRMLPYVDDPHDVTYLQQLADQIRQAIRQIPRSPDTFGIVHGDIHQGNCHFTAQGDVTLFDFSLCGVGWRGFDITGFLWPLRDDTYQQEAIRCSCDAYLAGYQSVRPLHPAEQAAIPAFVKVRDLWETGNWIELAPDTAPAVFSTGIRALLDRFRAFPLSGS